MRRLIGSLASQPPKACCVPQRMLTNNQLPTPPVRSRFGESFKKAMLEKDLRQEDMAKAIKRDDDRELGAVS